MNTVKTLLYMGSLHGSFTFYFPYQLAITDIALFDMGQLRYLAVPAWVIGTLVILWRSTDFIRKGRGTPAHVDPPKELVVSGPYRHVRNPIYAGALLIQFGYILWFGSGRMILYCPLFILAFHILIVIFEEPVLKRTFGTAYEQYCRSVPRWIPKLR